MLKTSWDYLFNGKKEIKKVASVLALVFFSGKEKDCLKKLKTWTIEAHLAGDTFPGVSPDLPGGQPRPLAASISPWWWGSGGFRAKLAESCISLVKILQCLVQPPLHFRSLLWRGRGQFLV